MLSAPSLYRFSDSCLVGFSLLHSPPCSQEAAVWLGPSLCQLHLQAWPHPLLQWLHGTLPAALCSAQQGLGGGDKTPARSPGCDVLVAGTRLQSNTINQYHL